MFNKFLRLLAEDIQRSYDLLSILFEDVDTFFLADKAMATVVNDAVDTNEFHACVAEMLHQFFWMSGAEI